MAKTVILGSNFAGMTAALEIRRKLGPEHEVLVVSPSKNFLFVPSLIWVPFGRRKVSDITFEIAPLLKRKGVGFIQDRAVRVLPDSNQVETAQNGLISYDYLVVATGCGLDFSAVPHSDPAEGYVQCIVTPKMAEESFEAFEKLVADPGPVVVGATQGASCMGAAYEYLFNLDKELRRKGVRDRVEITWITPEPYLGHFGIGGIRGGKSMLEMFMKLYKINWITEAQIAEIQKDKIILNDGRELPYKMSMLIPPFVGVDAIRNTPELSDARGFVPVNEGYQHPDYPNVYAAGLAVEVLAPFKNCKVPFGVPKTGYPSDVMGKVAAKNIIHAIKGDGKFEKQDFGKIPALCVMDAGHKEVLIFGNHFFKPRQFEIMLPNVFSDTGKVLLEKYMIAKNRHGWSYLP
ncbi:MAG: FAD-dependent oxidoreductase [Bacteroidia bacterium]|nr:FAD-dependent oxidoreductase [Bacteroidia bacterium]